MIEVTNSKVGNEILKIMLELGAKPVEKRADVTIFNESDRHLHSKAHHIYVKLSGIPIVIF